MSTLTYHFLPYIGAGALLGYSIQKLFPTYPSIIKVAIFIVLAIIVMHFYEKGKKEDLEYEIRNNQ